jgi:predicted nucleotidyltransferase
VKDSGAVAIQLWQTEEGLWDMRAARLDTILREFRDGLEQIYGSRLVRVVLFGSQARDEAEPDSDIDVMLVLQGAVDAHREIRRLSSFTSGLSLKHDVVISCVYVSEEDFGNQQSPLMLNVRREGVLV